jgi:DivIVA domain-containing protein
VRKGYQPQQVDAYLDLLTQHIGTRLGEEAS